MFYDMNCMLLFSHFRVYISYIFFTAESIILYNLF